LLWGLLLVLMLQTLSLLRTDLRGPAHIHESNTHQFEVRRISLSSQALGEIHGQSSNKPRAAHSHTGIEQHHHAAEVGIVLRPEAERQQEALSFEEGAGTGSSLNLSALLPQASSAKLISADLLRVCSTVKPLQGRALPSIERPPIRSR
jgi:hypothetical protein